MATENRRRPQDLADAKVDRFLPLASATLA
jgi:hypothetical protein